MKNVLINLCLIGLAVYAYQWYQSQAKQPQQVGSQETIINMPRQAVPTTSRRFNCDGRQHCSQMTSCAEAKYFIRNCPNTKMDGDHDGVPCERQWCN